LLGHFLKAAAKELNAEPKTLKLEVERYFTSLDWPGNVRQLENICRWLTVMAAGNEIHVDDLPPELAQSEVDAEAGSDWEAVLRRWADRQLSAGTQDLLAEAIPRMERAMIDSALRYTGGRRQDAARLLGWGRNTLTRKIKDHGI